MATIDGGDQDCTTGISGAIKTAALADGDNGFSDPLSSPQLASLHSQWHSIGTGVASVVNAAGGVGAGGLTSGSASFTGSDAGFGGEACNVAKTSASGACLVAVEIRFFVSSALSSGALFCTLPTGFRPALSWATIQAQKEDGSGALATFSVATNGEVRLRVALSTGVFSGSATFRSAG